MLHKIAIFTKKNMKNLLLFVLLFCTTNAFSQAKQINLETEIDNITVYLYNAEITSKKTVNLQIGQTEITFVNLSPYILDNSIRVSADNSQSVDILTFNTVTNYLTKKEYTADIKKLEDSIKILIERIQLHKDEIDALNNEKAILNANKDINGTNTSVDFNQLKQISEYNRIRIFEINKRLSFLNNKTNLDNQTLTKYQQQLNELKQNTTYTRKEIKVLVESQTALKTNITLSYIVTNCGWSPTYDIKAIDTDKPITLEYRALIYNNTQIPWNNVVMKLSTYNLSNSIALPDLRTWYVYPMQDQTYSKNYQYYQKSQIQSNAYLGDELYNQTDAQPPIIEQEFETTITQLSYEFELSKKQTIAANNKPYAIKINEKELQTTYEHYSIPKMNPDVLLIGRITGWENLNIVDGPANVFYAGSYVGKSFISASNSLDTLEISLGKDSKVIVKRSKVNKYQSNQVIGSKRKVTYSYKFDIKNFHKTAINLHIFDQIPISQSDDIEVKTIELSGAELVASTGKVIWKHNLAAGEGKSFEFSFYIKYPKNMTIPLTDAQNQTKIRYFNNY